MGNTLKPPTSQRPKQPPVFIKPVEPEPTMDRNMSIFISNVEYKGIIGLGRGITQPYSKIYSDCLRLKRLYPSVKTLDRNQLYLKFNEEIRRMSSSMVDIDEFYTDLSNNTPVSKTMIKTFLMNHLTTVIIQIVDIVIRNKTNGMINLTLNLPMLNSNMRDAINLTLTSIYDNKGDNIGWRSINMKVDTVIDIYINKLSNNNSFIANLFRLYTGEINFNHVVRYYRSGSMVPYKEENIDIYKILYDAVSEEIKNIENNVHPEVKNVIALKIFFNKIFGRLPRVLKKTGKENYKKSINNLKQNMLVYVLEELYGSTSTVSSTDSTLSSTTSTGRMLLSEVRNLIDKSKETYEYNEEDEEKCTEGGHGLSMYTIHMVFMVLLLFILLVLFLMNDKKRKLK